MKGAALCDVLLIEAGPGGVHCGSSNKEEKGDHMWLLYWLFLLCVWTALVAVLSKVITKRLPQVEMAAPDRPCPVCRAVVTGGDR